MIEYFWSRIKGKFVDKLTGKEICLRDDGKPLTSFHGTDREWCETLVDVVCDAANTINFKHGISRSMIVLHASGPIELMLMNSVLYGLRYFTLPITVMGNITRNAVELRHQSNGSVLGIVNVLDLP